MSTTTHDDGQLGALVRLRWTMMREPRQRRAVLFAVALLPALAVVAVVVGQLAPDNPDIRFNFALLAPTTFASFFVLTVDLAGQLGRRQRALPLRPAGGLPGRDRTVFGSTLLLAPANLAWMAHFLVLLGVTSYVAAPGPLVALSLVTTLTYAVAMTVVGQATAWWLEGARQRRAGRWSLRILAGSLVAALAVVQVSGNLTTLLNKLPTQRVAISAVQGRRVDAGPGRRASAVATVVLASSSSERGRSTSVSRLSLDARPGQRRGAAARIVSGAPEGRSHVRPARADAG